MRFQVLSVMALAAVTVPQVVVGLPIDSSSDMFARELNDIFMRDNEVLVTREPFLSKLINKGRKMLRLRANEAEDLVAREFGSGDMLMAREYDDILAREYEDFLSRDYDSIFARKYDDIFTREDEDLFSREVDPE